MTQKQRIAVPLIFFLASVALLTTLWLKQRSPTASTYWGAAPADVRAYLWPEPRKIGDFQLRTQHGELFTAENFVGQWNFIFFGFLRCPDVCPTSLHAIREMRKSLLAIDDHPQNYQFIFVTVDPDNDTPEQLREYLNFYEPSFVGLYGPDEQIQSLARPMAVRYIAYMDEDGNETIDHSSSLMVIDPQGRVVAALPPPLHPERSLQQFLRLEDYLETSH